MTKLLAIYRAELRLVVRATLAAALSLVFSNALGLPQGYWAALSALIIVQISLGGTIAAGIDRLIGTLTGALFGAVVALAGQVLDAPHVLVLMVAVAPLTLLAAIRPSFRVAPITAAIVLLATPSDTSPFISALHRFTEISIGTVIGVVVSLVVFPLRARRVAVERSAAMLKLLGETLELHLQPPDAANRDAIDRLNDRTLAELGRIATSAQEAHREHAMRLIEEPIQDRLVRTLRRLRSDVAFVGRATAAEATDWQALSPLLEETAGAFRAVFDALAEALLSASALPDFATIDAVSAKLHAAIGQGAPELLAALPFVIDTLRRDLGDLAEAVATKQT